MLYDVLLNVVFAKSDLSVLEFFPFICFCVIFFCEGINAKAAFLINPDLVPNIMCHQPLLYSKVPPCSWDDWFIVRYFVAFDPIPFEYMPIFVGFIDPLLDSDYSTQCMGCNRNPVGSQNLGTGSGPYKGHEEKSGCTII